MDEKLVQVIKGFLPDGTEVVSISKTATGEIKVEVKLPGDSANTTCWLKKNSNGEIYLD